MGRSHGMGLDTLHVSREAIPDMASSAPKHHILKSMFKNAFYTPVNQTDLSIFPFNLTFSYEAEVSAPLGKTSSK